MKPGTARDEAVAHIDLMPTLLEACEVDAASRMDGRSFLPLLTGESDEWPERELVIQAHRGDVVRRVEIAAGADEYTFEGVSLDAGDAEVHAVIAHGDVRRGVYQVEVSKRQVGVE